MSCQIIILAKSALHWFLKTDCCAIGMQAHLPISHQRKNIANPITSKKKDRPYHETISKQDNEQPQGKSQLSNV